MKGFIRTRTAADGKPRYQVVVKTDGRSRAIRTYRLKKDADAHLKRAEADIAAGTFGREELTFSDFAGRWLTDCEARVKPRTFQDYSQIVNTHLMPHFGRKNLSAINREDVQKYLTEKAGKLAPRTANKTLITLGAIFNEAVNQDLIGSNPVSRIKKLREPQEEMDFLNAEEVRRLLAALPEEHKPVIATAVMTGLRQGELLGLQWGDYDPAQRALFVRRTYRAGIGYGEPKSRQSRRAVQVPEILQQMLAEHRETVNTDADAPMFPSPGGQPWEHSNLIRRVFHPALKRAKIRRIRFHDLRHTYAALMVSRNANLKWLQGQMGHASITTTLDLYGHLLPDTGAGAPDALGALISGEVSTVGVSKSGFEEKTGDNMVTSEDSEAEVQ